MLPNLGYRIRTDEHRELASIKEAVVYSSDFDSFQPRASFSCASRRIALALQLQQARILQETSTHARHLECEQKGHLTPRPGQDCL